MPPSASTDSDKPTQRDRSVETNIESIRALDEQIREHEKAFISLKRARNSLLGVSKLPPEILGDIFRRNVTLKSDFGPLEERSHNFLLVYHHWFEVALGAPGLWGFWGNNLEDWTKRHLRHPMAPLDLVFNGGIYKWGLLNASVRNALQDRAKRDTIRRLHLNDEDPEFFNITLSPLAGCEKIRSISVESVVLQCDRDKEYDESPDVSDFLAYYHFHKLQRLELRNCAISSLDIQYPSPTITLSQLLSILRRNPHLEEITLDGCAIPSDGGGETSQAPLRHLRALTLTGGCTRPVFALLHLLDYPRNLNSLFIDLSDTGVGNISGIIGPYLQDYFRRRGRSRNGLGLHLSNNEDRIRFGVEDAGGTDSSAPQLVLMDTLVTMVIWDAHEDVLDLIAYVPRDEITYCRTCWIPMDRMSTQLPYLRSVHFEETPVHVAFPNWTIDQDYIFPSLQHIRITLDRESMGLDIWGPLMTFLNRLESSGNRLDTLEIDNFYPAYQKMEEGLRRAVREFRTKRNEE